MGYKKNEVIGKTSSELNLFADSEVQEQVAYFLQEFGQIKNIELNIRCKNGEIITGIFSGEIVDNQGEKALLTVMTDITEQKKAEVFMRESYGRQKILSEMAILLNSTEEFNLKMNKVLSSIGRYENVSRIYVSLKII